jgi:uncharacterized phage protein gp47/JayE
MATTPKIFGPDGVLRETVIFSTSAQTRFFSGTIPEDAADVQVSINGAGFSSDGNLILWGDGSWTVPNPNSEPDGLYLERGDNTVEVRAVLPSGSITPAARAVARFASPSEVRLVALSPTNISVVQKNSSVEVSAEASSRVLFRGMNFWASASPGGGATGYIRINVNLVTEGVLEEEDSPFADIFVDSLVPVDGNGDPLADPLFVRVRQDQENSSEIVLQSDLNQTWEVPESTRKIRLSGTLSSVRQTTKYSFDHHRDFGPTSLVPTVGVGAFASLPANQPLYYVVTAIYWDPDQNLEFESAYSEEVVGHPTQINTALVGIPSPNRQAIVQSFVSAVFRSNPQIRVEAGSVLRDVVIDPFSSEAERIRFVLDFFQRSRTPALLLQVDDPNLTGTSVPVSSSPYKQALQASLYLGSATAVQNLIDASFEAYASNFGLFRRSGTAAGGEVLFYTTRRPTQSIVIPLGTTVSGGGIVFSTTRASGIYFDQLASFYDPVSGRYGVRVPVRAEEAGSRGNIGTGQVRNLSTKLPGSVSVSNPAPMFGGRDQESNLDLSIRVQNALASVDSGTAQGYSQTAADVPGVLQARVIAAGDPLMLRDLEGSVHRGGKVDVWVQGENLSTVTDVFAFTYDVVQDVQFELIGLAQDLEFQALDPELSPANPILQMLDDPSAGFEFKNASTGDVFDLTGVAITSYNTIQLNTTLPQPSLALGDVVLGSYRRRSGNQFVFPRQPVSSISSVVGQTSGTLDPDYTLLVHPESPLLEGRSNLAGDLLQVTQYLENGSLVPSGDTISVVGESHVMTGAYPEFLDFLGANYLTLKVWNSSRTVIYKGPYDPSGTPDYQITLGGQTQALSITRTPGSQIGNGEAVSVDYDHDENFTVTYTTNQVVSVTQEALDAKKHATADVLAKEALPLPVDLEVTVVFTRGRDSSKVDSTIRTNLSNFFGNFRLGQPVRQSDVIRVIENTDGVSYVVVPLSKMLPASGTAISREDLSTDTAAESSQIPAYSSNKSLAWILTQALEFSTTNGGGPEGDFRGVFQDDVGLSLLSPATPLTALGNTGGQAYIIGSGGLAIPGYSDDATLIAQGYTTPAMIVARRLELTANHILVSCSVGTSPADFSYWVSYVTTSGAGAKDVDPNDCQYVSQGEVTLTLDEDR